MAGDLVYFVLPTPDAERARAFYGAMFGWDFSPGNVPGGFNIEGSSPRGGLFGGGEGSSPTVYFSVDDIDEAVGKVRDLGGDAEDPQEIASGYMSHCRDDQGTSFAIWAPRQS